MFIQVIKGAVDDRAGLRQQFDAWREQLAPGADGWLGVTAGITDDGNFIGAVRFSSEEAARRNSDRPEQGSWWAQTQRCFAGEVTFTDCIEVDQVLGGGSDAAGFVQVIEGRAADRERLREVTRKLEGELGSFRPEIIGWTVAWHGDDGFTETVYFTSEEEAREGEAKPMPAGSGVSDEEWASLMSDLRYWDLREPWLFSP